MKAFDHDMINRFLEGEMNTAETTAFEVQMQQDADLRNTVELYREVNQILKMKLHPGGNEMALRNSLQAMRDEFFSGENVSEQSKVKIVPFRRTRWIAAAAAVCIGIVMLTIWSPWKKQGLYEQYASIQMPGVVERGTPSDSLLKKATDNFNDKKFVEAIPLFETILKNDPQNSYVQFYYAVALQQGGQQDKARPELTLLFNGTSQFRYDAAFFMALSYLKENDATTCREWLHKIPEDAGSYDKARDLLKEL